MEKRTKITITEKGMSWNAEKSEPNAYASTQAGRMQRARRKLCYFPSPEINKTHLIWGKEQVDNRALNSNSISPSSIFSISFNKRILTILLPNSCKNYYIVTNYKNSLSRSR